MAVVHRTPDPAQRDAAAAEVQTNGEEAGRVKDNGERPITRRCQLIVVYGFTGNEYVGRFYPK